MEDKTMLGDFIFALRKEKNLSQSELGQLVGVSNKAVSKWETCESNPDLQIIPKLASVLGVTTDELLSCQRAEKSDDGTHSQIGMSGKTTKSSKHYEFVSRQKTKKGTPYVHINLGLDENGKVRKAKGVVAVGIVAKGVVSAGIVSIGVFSLGLVSLGILAFGSIALGLIVTLGGVAAGLGVSVGGVAVGTIAIGGAAVGITSVGGLSVGIWAHTGELGKAIGKYIFFHKFQCLKNHKKTYK